jgi:hypothetical protein
LPDDRTTSTSTPTSTPTPAPADKLDPIKAARLREALVADAEQILSLLQDPDPEVVANLLKNRHLAEEHLLALLKRRNLPEQMIKSIYKKAGSSRQLKIALAAHPNTPASVLSSLLPKLFLFELVTVLLLSGTPEDQKLAAEREILKRLPQTELGNRIALARRATPAILEGLLKGSEPRLVEAVLANPKLKEPGVLSFLRSPAATAETISIVARDPRWGGRANVRFALLRNRNTPLVWFTLLLPRIAVADLKALAGSPALTAEQRAEVRQELERR